MRLQDVQRTMKECERFMEAARKYEMRVKDSRVGGYRSASKEGGTVKRASMDLTRSLAEMRKDG
jgi:hypothetical protein